MTDEEAETIIAASRAQTGGRTTLGELIVLARNGPIDIRIDMTGEVQAMTADAIRRGWITVAYSPSNMTYKVNALPAGIEWVRNVMARTLGVHHKVQPVAIAPGRSKRLIDV